MVVCTGVVMSIALCRRWRQTAVRRQRLKSLSGLTHVIDAVNIVGTRGHVGRRDRVRVIANS
jgi:hypothetical protein